METDIFKNGENQTIQAVLANKDRRDRLQKQLLADNPTATIVAVKLNVPGPIKNNEQITQLFNKGDAAFANQLQQTGKVTSVLNKNYPTGPESFYVIDEKAAKVKNLAVKFEDSDKLGRLFDVDVIDHQSGHLSRKERGHAPRKCFLCDKDAKECGRNRTHSVAELQAYINKVYNEEFPHG